MKPTNNIPKNITLPDDLSPQAAMALYDLLSELLNQVWRHYEPLLVAQIISEITPPPDNPYDFDDDIPC